MDEKKRSDFLTALSRISNDYGVKISSYIADPAWIEELEAGEKGHYSTVEGELYWETTTTKTEEETQHGI